MKFFEDFVCVLQMILLTKIKKIFMTVLGLNSKNRKSTRDKANIRNPKINRGCAPLTANHTSADCVQISLGHSITYIPLGVYHTGVFNAMIKIGSGISLVSLGKGPSTEPILTQIYVTICHHYVTISKWYQGCCSTSSLYHQFISNHVTSYAK